MIKEVSTESPGANLPVIYRPPLVGRNDQFSTFALVCLILSFGLYVLLSYLHQDGRLSDEGFHQPYVQQLMKGEFDNLSEKVTTPPLFHAIVAFFTQISGVKEKTLEMMRFVQLAMSISVIPFLFFISNALGQPNRDIKTLVCALLPLSFPLWGIVYTDPPAIAATLAGVYFCLRRQHLVAALILSVGLGIRQLTIVWACFCAFYAMADWYLNYRTPAQEQKYWKLLPRLILVASPYLIPLMILVIYSVVTGGVVTGDRKAHSITFNSTNLFTFLLVSSILLFPYIIQHFQSVIQLLTRSKKVWFFLVGLFVWYFASFKITHGYNNPASDYWLHNRLLDFSTNIPLAKLLCYFPIAWMSLTFYSVVRDHDSPWQMWLIYAFGVTSFLFLPLVEWRYYSIALILFLLWAPVRSLVVDRTLLIFYLCLSYFLIYGQVDRMFFL